MKIHIDIRDDIPADIALRCVAKVIEQGRVSANGKMYAYATTLDTNIGEVIGVCMVVSKEIFNEHFEAKQEQ